MTVVCKELNLFKPFLLTTPIFSEMKCPLCISIISNEVHFSKHFVQAQSIIELKISLHGLYLRKRASDEIFSVGLKSMDFFELTLIG